MDNEARQPHPHASLIKAWADGKTLQIYDRDSGKWTDYPGIPKSFFAEAPQEKPEWQYRIKPQEPEQWKPGVYEFYYSVTSQCTVSEYKYIDDGLDKRRIAIGNCFKTEAEAEAAAERVRAALKGEKPKESERWKPMLGETYFYIGEHALVYNDVWEGCDSEERYWKSGNIFKTEKEAEAAAERFMFVFCDEEPEFLKKLRKENEELKTRNENLHKAKELAIKENEELKREIRKLKALRDVDRKAFSPHLYLYGRQVSGGELALIRAIRSYKLQDVMYHENGGIIGIDHDKKIVTDLAIGIDFEGDGHLVFKALEQIKAEQQAPEEEYHSLAT